MYIYIYAISNGDGKEYQTLYVISAGTAGCSGSPKRPKRSIGTIKRGMIFEL